MSDPKEVAKAEEAAEWHLETLRAVISQLEELYDERGLGPEVQHRMRVDDNARLVREHLEGFEFEYDRLRRMELGESSSRTDGGK